MIKRILFLFALVIVFVVVAWMNPPPKPEAPGNSRLIKISTDGEQMGAWDGPWSCVLDTSTGLTWEIKSYVEDLHDYQCSFSWFDGRMGMEDGGSCFTPSGKSNTQNLIDYTNQEKRCGADNWRLPTEDELKTLLLETPLPGDMLIARDYFPYTQRGLYWTAASGVPLTGHFKRLGKGAISIDFKDGGSRKMPYRDAAFVRLVAGKTGKSGPESANAY